MAKIPKHLRYTEDHEWVFLDDGTALIGITDHAQDQLGDIVYLGEFPDIGDEIERGDVIGVIESVKATSDIYAPLTATVVEINAELIDGPEVLNDDPYEGGWMMKLKFSDPDELEDLHDSAAYNSLVENEA
ncbi:MAG: glycine cleavage system protein GcvH [Proteobacteria bacterium]|nr:glycine cleavage system protein GcvH [Pseudomonadota bacterium]